MFVSDVAGGAAACPGKREREGERERERER